MSKLWKLKSWLTLEDAAKRLSSAIEEAVTVEDVLQLVIERRLPLSWYARRVLGKPVVRCCRLTHLFMDDLAELEGESRPDRSFFGPVTWVGRVAYRSYTNTEGESGHDKYAHTTWADLYAQEVVEELHGAYRLEIDESVALEEWVHSLLTGTRAPVIDLSGFIVSEPGTGLTWKIVDWSWAEPKPPSPLRRGLRKLFFYPSGALPAPTEFVILREDIEAFEASLLEEESPKKVDDVPLSAKERNTLLVIVAALAKEANLDIQRPYKAAEFIEAITDEMGAHVTSISIAKHLKNVPHALLTRATPRS